MEKMEDGTKIPEISPAGEVSLDSSRVQGWLDRRKLEQAQLKLERQAERRQGRLTPSLTEKLRACTIDQLKQAKKLCDRYTADQQKPPLARECGGYTVKVLSTVCVKNKRYQLEFQRTTRTAKKIYVNGPYIRSYHRDGNVIIVEKFKSKDKQLYKKLPRKVWSTFKDKMSDPALESERQALITKQNDSN